MTTRELPGKGALVTDVESLEQLLSEPTPGVIEQMRRLEGDLLLLGAGGKMGPTLARMARRASDMAGVRRRVIGVSRFSSDGLETELRAHGIETMRADLLDETELAALPDAPNVIYMTGMKFGASNRPGLTWTMNTWLPGMVCQKYRRSRIVAFSTGNIYGLMRADSGGSREEDAPAPIGEYAMSALGRERVFQHFSESRQIPLALIRLNYACELRYGILVDLAQQVFAGEPVRLETAHFNIIWQGDANAMTLQAFGHLSSPPFVINVTGRECLSVREVCEQFARFMGKPVRFTGEPSPVALLSNAGRAHQLFDPPRVAPDQLIEWIADWVMRGGATLGKPTHFEVNDGKF